MQKIILLILTNLFIIILPNNAQETWINIFVHGTVGIRSNFNLCTFRRLIKDAIEGSEYQQNVLSIRNNTYLFTTQPMQQQGLHEIVDGCSYPCGPYAFAQLFDTVLSKYNCNSSKNLYYTFGWTGLLSYKYRFSEARVFYLELRKLIENFVLTRGIKPKIRLIGYSHGASIIINLAAVREFEFVQDYFSIDQVIALGLPVQKATAELIDHPIFKKIYHVYSRSDAVQRLDIFSPHDFISQRKFRYCLPKKLTQIEVKVTAKLLQNICVTLPQGLRGTINQSPGHIELWFFGWTQRLYRRNFTFWPLPMAIFLPYLTYISENFSSNHITIDLRPDQELTIVTNRCTRKKFCMPFIDKPELDQLKAKALEFHPQNPKYHQKYLELERQFRLISCE